MRVSSDILYKTQFETLSPQWSGYAFGPRWKHILLSRKKQIAVQCFQSVIRIEKKIRIHPLDTTGKIKKLLCAHHATQKIFRQFFRMNCLRRQRTHHRLCHRHYRFMRLNRQRFLRVDDCPIAHHRHFCWGVFGIKNIIQ